MIVGSVELQVAPLASGFYAEMVKTTDPAADKAGSSAGRLFGAAFVKNMPSLATALARNSEGFAAAAESEGSAAGAAFSRGYIAGVEKSNAATQGLFANGPRLAAEAETEGAATGRAFALGMGEQMSLFGTEGLEAGRAFSTSFVRGTARIGASESAAIREGGAAAAATAEATGAEAGAAFSRGQRRGMLAGGTETAAFSRFGQGAEVAGFSAGTRFANAMKGGVTLGAVALVAGTAYIAGKFQQATNILVTAAGEDSRALGLVRKGILDIAAATGTKWQDLTDGMFQIEKAGIRGADGLKVLRAAAQGAREEGADLKTVTGSLTSALLDYHLPADAAVTVTNEMKTAAGEAKSTFEEFDRGLGRLLPMASSLHISLADVSGSLAEMTQHGFSAQDSSDQLSNAMRNLAKSNAPAQKMMAQLGIDSQDVALKLGDGPGGRGLAGTMQYLSTVVLQHMGPAGLVLLNTMNQSKIASADAATMLARLGPEAQRLARGFQDGTISLSDYRKQARALPGEQGVLAMQFLTTESNAKGFQSTLRNGLAQNQTYNAMMQTMTGGANGLSVALNLTGQNAADTNIRIGRIADSARNAGANVSGWDSTQRLFNVRLDQTKQKAAAATITLGNLFLPFLGALIGPVGNALAGFANLAERVGKILTPLFHDLGKQLSEFGRIVKPAFDAFRDSPLFKPAMLLLLSAILVPIGLLAVSLKVLALAFRDVINPVARFVAVLARDVPGALGAVGRFFARTYNDVTGFAVRMWRDVTGWFSRTWRDVTGFASRIWHDVTGFFSRIYRDVTGAVGSAVNFIQTHWRLLITIFAGPIGFVIDLVFKFRRQVGGFFQALWHDVSTFAARMWRDVTGWFARMYHDVAAFAARIWSDVVSWTSRMWRDVTGLAARIWRDTTSWFSRLWHDLVTFALRIWRDVTDPIVRLAHGLFDIAASIWRDSTGWFSRLWHDLVDFATRIWHDVERPFQALWGGLKTGFADVVHGIETAWNKLKSIFAVPINFLIQYVYDDGIVKVWNAVMNVVGEKAPLHPIDKIKLDRGGGLSGPARGDDRLAMVGGGEHMWTAAEVQAAGGHEAVAAMRSNVLGRPVRVMGDGSGSYFFGGGVLGDVGHALSSVGSAALHGVEDIGHALEGLVRGAMADTAGPLLNGAVSLLAKLIPGDSPVEKATIGLGHNMVDKVMNWIRGQDARDAATMGLLGGQPISWNGGPVTVGLIEMLARGLPGGNAMQVTSTTGGGHAGGSYHYKGEAVDFSNGTGNTPEMLAFDRAWAQRYGSSLAELIYTAPGSVFVKDGAGVPPSFYSGVLDEHRNHVHVAISPASIARGHQGFQPFSNAGGPAGETGLVQFVNRAAQARGWGGQLGALDWIIQRESGWNPRADNPSSTAYGLFQMLTERSSDPGVQTQHGLDYIGGRYGNPNNAQAFWQRHGWYDTGGDLLPGTTVVHNGTGRVEKVLDADETVAYEAGQRRARGRAGMQVNQTNHIHGVDQPTADRLAARRLALALAGAGVNS